MQVSLVITILGPDRPGLVKSLSQTLNHFGGSWTESRMAHLAGKFAGLLRVQLPVEQLEELTSALHALESENLKIQIEKTADQAITPPVSLLHLELLGQDRPGIIHDVTQELAKLNVNIEELESEVTQASMSGDLLFNAKLTLGLPEGITAETVQDALEAMSDQFMVDLNFSS